MGLVCIGIWRTIPNHCIMTYPFCKISMGLNVRNTGFHTRYAHTKHSVKSPDIGSLQLIINKLPVEYAENSHDEFAPSNLSGSSWTRIGLLSDLHFHVIKSSCQNYSPIESSPDKIALPRRNRLIPEKMLRLIGSHGTCFT